MSGEHVPLEPDAEAQQLLRLCDGNMGGAVRILDGQLNTLHARAQVLMGLAGVVVTVTGFSGRTIAGTSLFGQVTVVLGLAVVLGSAVWLYGRALHIRWLTRELGRPDADALVAIIQRRNAKTSACHQAGVVLCLGLALYGLAIASMLLSPGG